MPSAIETLCAHTFETRDKRAVEPRVQKGTFVKLGIRGERFWCRVRHIHECNHLVGELDNHLLRSPWKPGDEISFQRIHILETMEPADELTFHTLHAALGSASEAAMMLHAARAAKGLAAKARPPTLFLLPSE